MLRINNVLACIMIFFLASCVSKKNIVYFQEGEINQAKVSNSYKTIFKPDDILQITVSADDLEAVKPFNLPVVTYSLSTDRAVGNPIQQSYLVDNEGYIDFPELGKLKVGGLTRKETIKMLKDKLSPKYVKNPIINIRINNYKISVLGDVQKPGSYTIPNERITILDAIALAGDLNISGDRRNIVVHREEGGKKNFYKVNILSKEILTSPVFYLQQNDVVYVEQNYAKSQSASYNQNTPIFISITGILISIITLIAR